MDSNDQTKIKLRVGTVKFLNAKPLDYGFLTYKSIESSTLYIKDYNISLLEDVPSKLIELLLQKKLDIGLISTIEALKHKEFLNYYPLLGICANKKVDSIFFIKKNNDFNKPVKKIYLDKSSRSSIALLKILYFKTFEEFPEFILENPENIINKMDKDSGGLLIGDPAIQLYLNKQNYYLKDLAAWWYEITGFPFVFAVWAYRKDISFNTNIFEESYTIGIKSIKKIIDTFPFPYDFSYNYLNNILYYRIQSREIESIYLYEALLKELGLF